MRSLCHWCFMAILIVGMTVPIHAGECERCGCESGCHRVCRLVCEMKETTKVTYGCKCEDICVPGPSERRHDGCACGNEPTCSAAKWIPTSGWIKTRKVLVRHEEKVLKPTYRWVVEYVCGDCAARAEDAPAQVTVEDR